MKERVVDASVALKWVLTEVHSDAAARLLADKTLRLHVPELLFAEIGNALWKRVRAGTLEPEAAARILAGFPDTDLVVHQIRLVAPLALHLAVTTGRTVYDCIYLALAMLVDGRVVTADRAFYNALRGGPLAQYVMWVEDDL